MFVSLVVLLIIQGVYSLQGTQSFFLNRRFRLELKSESIDPLDYVHRGDGKRVPGNNDGKRRIPRDIPFDYGDSSVRKFENIEDKGQRNEVKVDNAYVHEFLRTIEAEMLQRLPFEMTESFQSYLFQLLPRVSILSLVLHLMLLIPTLRFVKLELHQSIYPYLYLGPLLILLPFALFFFGEKKLYEQPFMLEKVEAYLSVQKDLATAFLRDEEEHMMAVLDELLQENSSDKTAESLVRNIALARLLSRIEVEFLSREVLSLNRSRLGLRGNVEDNKALSLVTSTENAPSLGLSPSFSSSSRSSKGANPVKLNPLFSSLDDAGSFADTDTTMSTPFRAAFRLIEDLRQTEEGQVRTDTEILVELRALQDQLESSDGADAAAVSRENREVRN